MTSFPVYSIAGTSHPTFYNHNSPKIKRSPMTLFLYPFVTFLVSALSTLIAMPILLRFCKVRGLYDTPNERKVHHNNIPRLGGVLFAPALAIGMETSLALMILLDDSSFHIGLSTCLLFGALFMIFCIGLVDDIFGLDAKIKFAVQALASMFMSLCNLYINNLYGFCGIYEIPVYIGYPLTVLMSLLIINAINLIDGIDGLASSLSIIILAIFSFVFIRIDNMPFTMLTAGMIGPLLVFWCYNMFGSAEKGTKTFMGDTGSLILGFTFSYLCIKYAMFNPNAIPLQTCPILLSFTLLIIPVFDLIRVAIERLCEGRGMFSPDKRHIHHLFLGCGFSMHQSLACILAIQLAYDAFNCICFYYLHISSTLIVAFDIASYAGTIFLLKRLQGKKKAA